MTSLITFGGNADFVFLLVKARVEFLVIGGLAVAFHKCRSGLNVDDLDLLMNPSVENVKRFIDVLKGLNVCSLPSIEQWARPNLRINFRPFYYLDVLTPGEEVTGEDVNFSELLSRSEQGCLQGNQGDIPVYIISLPDLVKMKRKAVQKLSEEKKKHEDDLRCLEGCLAVGFK
jgi:hypothetical protein